MEKNMIELQPYEEKVIRENLPPHHAALKAKYPSAVYNAASAQNLPTLSSDYIPQVISLCYGEETNEWDVPNLSFIDGDLDLIYMTEACASYTVLQIFVDGFCAYVEIERQILLDRTGDLVLPDIKNVSKERLETVIRKNLHLYETLFAA
jgi:hypothetical protein